MAKKRARKAFLVKKSRYLGFMTVVLIVLLLLLFFLFIQVGILPNFFESKIRTDRLFLITDECQFIVGQFIHTVEDDSDCANKCRNLCSVREFTYVNSTFNSFIESFNVSNVDANNRTIVECNKCDCICNG